MSFELDIPVATALFARYGLTVRCFERIPRGVTNPAYLVDGRWVLRVQNREPLDDKFQREHEALLLARQSNVPAPAVVFFDNGKSGFRFPTLCTEKMAGVPLDEVWGTLLPSERSDAARSFGATLASIHLISLERYGDLLDTRKQTRVWDEILTQSIRERVEAAREHSSVPDSLLVEIETLLLQVLSFSCRQSFLTHGDYQPSNVHLKGGTISGVFDFEWAMGGDPEYDFRVIDNSERKAPGLLPGMLEGYTSVRSLSSEFYRKVLYYQLLWRLGITTLAKRFWGDEAYRDCCIRLQLLCAAIKDGKDGPLLYTR